MHHYFKDILHSKELIQNIYLHIKTASDALSLQTYNMNSIIAFFSSLIIFYKEF